MRMPLTEYPHEHPARRAARLSRTYFAQRKKQEWLELWAEDGVIMDPLGKSYMDPAGEGFPANVLQAGGLHVPRQVVRFRELRGRVTKMTIESPVPLSKRPGVPKTIGKVLANDRVDVQRGVVTGVDRCRESEVNQPIC